MQKEGTLRTLNVSSNASRIATVHLSAALSLPAGPNSRSSWAGAHTRRLGSSESSTSVGPRGCDVSLNIGRGVRDPATISSSRQKQRFPSKITSSDNSLGNWMVPRERGFLHFSVWRPGGGEGMRREEKI